MRWRAASGETPSAAATEIWSKLALLAGDPLGLGQRQLGDAGAAERVVVAERRDADQPCSSVTLRLPATYSMSPISRPLRSAVCLSIVASRAVRGGWPSRVQRLEALGLVRGDEVRGEAAEQRIAVLLDELAEREDRAGGRLDAVHALGAVEQRGGEGRRVGSSCSTSVLPVMTTSVPLSESLKIWSKDLLIVSVRT